MLKGGDWCVAREMVEIGERLSETNSLLSVLTVRDGIHKPGPELSRMKELQKRKRNLKTFAYREPNQIIDILFS